MFTPSELEQMPIPLEKRMTDLEMNVMQDIIRRIRINDEVTRSADWQIYRLVQMGQNTEYIQKQIQLALKLSDDEINKLYEGAIQSGYTRDRKIYEAVGKEFIPFKDNQELQQLIQSIIAQTQQEMVNITQTLGFTIGMYGKMVFTPLSEYLHQVLDTAMLEVTSGTFDYNSTLKKIVTEMTKSGLRTVGYASGHYNRIEVAARRALMTGITQVTTHINESNAAELGTDKYEVSWHATARPSHQEWQGRVYTMQQLKNICGLGTGDGLMGWNCYHSYYPFIEGVSERQWTDEQLDKMNAKENDVKKFKDKEYTSYEATQRQRELETLMRAQRRKIKLLKSGAASEEDIQSSLSWYRETMRQYKIFSEEMKLPQQMERVYMDGLGKVSGNKTGRAAFEVTADIKDKFTQNEIIKPVLTADSVTADGKSILERAYENHRIRNNMTSVPASELGDFSPIKADYSNMSVESAAAFNDTIDNLTSEYDTSLYKIKTMPKDEAFLNNSFAYVSHDYTTDTSQLVINPLKCKDHEKLVSRIKELSNDGYCARIPDNLAEQYIATHEFGHSLLNMEIPLKNSTNWLGADYGKIKQARKEISNIYEKYTKDISELTAAQKKAELKALSSFEQDAWDEARKASEALNNAKISNYSLQNADEFLAESFTNERIGVKSNPYAKEVYGIINKYFKR